ncbi:MAG: hypothetical protein C6Y22_14260 [Hapalosiphonaceae cyanobacterium JJU2]|nr:MAG: hypothetical protein C6Y22_14260 [Hapalosiphonaceae cyanobacterium JJU2]
MGFFGFNKLRGKVGWVEERNPTFLRLCWVTLREAPSGLRSSNARCYNGGDPRNALAPQPTLDLIFSLNTKRIDL